MKKKFDSVRFQRQQRKKLSMKLSEMSNEEILAYFKSQRPVKAKTKRRQSIS